MKKRYGIVCALSFLVAGILYGRDKKARSSAALYELLAKSPYAVVLLYDAGKKNKEDKRFRQRMKDLTIMFRSLSDDEEYKDAKLLFVRANVGRYAFDTAMRRMGVVRLPAIQLFRGRQPIAGAQLQGHVTREQINRLIERFLRADINETFKEQARAQKRALERAKIRAYNRAYWGPYWYGPYWYGGYGYPYRWGYGYGPRYGFYAGW